MNGGGEVVSEEINVSVIGVIVGVKVLLERFPCVDWVGNAGVEFVLALGGLWRAVGELRLIEEWCVEDDSHVVGACLVSGSPVGWCVVGVVSGEGGNVEDRRCR